MWQLKKIAKKQFSILARRHFVFAVNGGGGNGSYYGDDLALYRSKNIREHFHEIAPILYSCSAWTCAGCTLKSLVLFYFCRTSMSLYLNSVAKSATPLLAKLNLATGVQTLITWLLTLTSKGVLLKLAPKKRFVSANSLHGTAAQTNWVCHS